MVLFALTICGEVKSRRSSRLQELKGSKLGLCRQLRSLRSVVASSFWAAGLADEIKTESRKSITIHAR